MALSDQLMDLAKRTKRLEDAAAAAQAQNRAKLEQDREKLHSTMSTEAQKLQSSAGEAKSQARSWWTDMTKHIEEQRAEVRGKIDQRRAERKVDQAKRNAADAEDYAADVVSVAVYVVDAAEYAVVDAAIARSEADALVAST